MLKTLVARDQLERVVAETLPSIPEGHNSAVAGIVDFSGAKFVASMRLGADGSWKVLGAFEHSWTGENKVAVEVFRTWKS